MPIVRVLCLAFALLFATSAVPHPAAAPAGDSLYKRLGGHDAIAAVVDDFIARMIPSLEDTLDKFKVGPREKREAVAFVGSVKADIVEKP